MFEFTEFRPSTATDFEPIRNPLREVRWWGFLRGDAYVNPFHDLVYAFSRSTAAGARPDPTRRYFAFAASGITVTEGKERITEHRWAGISELQLRFSGPNYQSPYQAIESGIEYGRAVFREADEHHHLTFRVNGKQFVALCEFLLTHRVSFREFNNGSRSFLLDTNLNYRKIQRLKERYDIVW